MRRDVAALNPDRVVLTPEPLAGCLLASFLNHRIRLEERDAWIIREKIEIFDGDGKMRPFRKFLEWLE